jgi:micrococcal nuclease
MTDGFLQFKKQRRTAHRTRSLPRVVRSLALWIALIAMIGGVIVLLGHDTPGSKAQQITQLWNRTVAPFRVSPTPAEGGITRRMLICSGPTRVNCVVDGDTVWIDGEKIRLQSINAPEIQGECRQERELAQRATRRLSDILSSSSFHIERSGKDRYGRTLATLSNKQGDVGQILIREKLAHPWRGRRESWC